MYKTILYACKQIDFACYNYGLYYKLYCKMNKYHFGTISVELTILKALV